MAPQPSFEVRAAALQRKIETFGLFARLQNDEGTTPPKELKLTSRRVSNRRFPGMSKVRIDQRYARLPNCDGRLPLILLRCKSSS